MSVDLQEVARLLQASLDPSQSGQGMISPCEVVLELKLTSIPAEAALKETETQPGFSLVLLQIAATDSYPQARLASALFFKNFIRRNWVDEDGNHKLPPQEVATIKSELIGLMVRVPPTIRTQLAAAISIIADSDFWERWDTLVDELVSKLTADDPEVNAGVLEVADSIFSRWEPLYRSDELYT